jgi:hypothetical protein
MKWIPCSLALVTLCGSVPAFAQGIVELPRPSPTAKIVQNVGLTELSVEYSSPRVNGRKIWGGVVPYGEVWRAGANAATKISVGKNVVIAGTEVPAGSYALFVIPQKTGAWTLILSKKAEQPGAFAYKKEEDLLRAEIKPQPIPLRERLAYSFSDFANQNHVTLELEWEKVRLALPIQLHTDEQVAANLKTYQENQWVPYNTAARYMLEQKKDYDAGIDLVDKSIAVKEQWFNDWTKAQLLAAKGKFKDALALAQKADALGGQIPADRYFFKDDVKKALSEWKSK